MSETFMESEAFISLSKDKQQFLKNFAENISKQKGSELATTLALAAKEAQNNNIQFSKNETELLIQIIKNSMSEAERKKADRILQLVNTYHPY